MIQSKKRLTLLIIASLLVGWLLVSELFGSDNFLKPDTEVKVLGLVCPSCAVGLKNSLKKHPKLLGFKINTKKQLLLLDFKENKEGSISYIKNEEIIKIVKKSGYEVYSIKRLANIKPNRYNSP